MRHADHDVFEAVHPAARLDQVLEQRNQAVAALQRESLLRRVARGEVALEALGHREVPEDVLPVLHREVLLDAADLEAILQPQALGLVRDVRELGADRAAINVLQLRNDLAQLEARLDRLVAAARHELGVEVRFAQAEVVEAEHLRSRADHQAERVDVGDQVTAVRVDLDHPRDRALLRGGTRARHDDLGGRTGTRAAGFRPACQFLDQRAVRDVALAAAETDEEITPLRLHGLGRRQELLVQRLHVRGIARRERRRGQHRLEFAHRA